jgi:hypothetical protein
LKNILRFAPLVALIFTVGCGVNHVDARRALEAQGITNVQIGGYSFFGCSKDDGWRSTFTGIGANGKPINGVVCQGLLKGTTIRFD